MVMDSSIGNLASLMITGHQLGDRSDRQYSLVIFAEQNFLSVLVNHIGNAGLQIQNVVGCGMQASFLAKRRNRWGCLDHLTSHVRLDHHGL